MLVKVLVTIASIISIGFGAWHFFVPAIWNWYSYIEKSATELVLAVRAINFFFSLCLVLFGLMNMLLTFNKTTSRHTMLVLLSANILLWISRCVFQVVYPQGSASAVLQYSMLGTFLFVLGAYLLSLGLVIMQKE